MKEFKVRPFSQSDRDWAISLLTERWGSPKIVTRGKIHYAPQLPGFVAVQNKKSVGLVTYRIESGECEIVTMDSLREGCGIGSALLEAVKDVAVSSKCRRIWLITTNDNLAAMRFFQKRGFLLVAVHRNALEKSRKLKKEIPLLGIDGIPLRDEIELEMPLSISEI